MYFIAYRNGTKICDGYAPTVEKILSIFPGTYKRDGSLFAEVKYTRTDKTDSGCAIYVRPNNDPPGCSHPNDDKVYSISQAKWLCPHC